MLRVRSRAEALNLFKGLQCAHNETWSLWKAALAKKTGIVFMIEILHDLIYQSRRSDGSITYSNIHICMWSSLLAKKTGTLLIIETLHDLIYQSRKKNNRTYIDVYGVMQNVYCQE